MQRQHRDRDILWLTSGLSFLTWASATLEGVHGAGAWRKAAARDTEPFASASGPGGAGPLTRRVDGRSRPPGRLT